jgi:hypothetical protein
MHLLLNIQSLLSQRTGSTWSSLLIDIDQLFHLLTCNLSPVRRRYAGHRILISFHKSRTVINREGGEGHGREDQGHEGVAVNSFSAQYVTSMTQHDRSGGIGD